MTASLIYIFFRAEGWCPIVIPADRIAERGEDRVIKDNIELNPGTLRVESSDGRVVWRQTEHTQDQKIDALNRVARPEEPARAAGGDGRPLQNPEADSAASDHTETASPPVPTLQDASHVPPMRMLKDAEENFLHRESPSQEGRAGELRAEDFLPPVSEEVLEEEVGWVILLALHLGVPENERPQSWSDMDAKQEDRIRSAARSAIKQVRLNTRAPAEKPSGLKLHFTNEWLRRKIAEEPDDASCEAGVLHPDAPIPDSDLRKIIDGQRAIIERLRQERDEAYTELVRDTDAAILRRALLRIRSYNEDIHADKMNYRPLDHIQVIDEALAIAGRSVGTEGDTITGILSDMKASGSWDAATMDRVMENVTAVVRGTK